MYMTDCNISVDLGMCRVYRLSLPVTSTLFCFCFFSAYLDRRVRVKVQLVRRVIVVMPTKKACAQLYRC